MDHENDDLQIDTPVAIVIFKRTGPLKKLLDVLRRVEPPEMYVIADGPRDHVDGEAQKVKDTRKLAEENIDWNCKVRKNYADENMGGPHRIPTGVDWLFEQVERAIILEDDMLPAPEFFRYCEQLLERYEDNPEVMEICGNNAGSAPSTNSSYFFSNFHRTMGWATWRRAWQLYDPTLEDWPVVKEEGILYERYHLKEWADNHTPVFDFLYDDEDERNYWDATWQYSIVANDGKTILPAQNLVVHAGYGKDATHTEVKPYFRQMLQPSLDSMSFPLDHPDEIETSVEFERNYAKYKHSKIMDLLNLMDRVLHKLPIAN